MPLRYIIAMRYGYASLKALQQISCRSPLSLRVIPRMHHVLRDGCDATQCDDSDDDLGCGLKYEGKNAGEAHHKQHAPGKAALAYDGSQAPPKAVHRNPHRL